MLTEMKPLVRKHKGTTKVSVRIPNAVLRVIEEYMRLSGKDLSYVVNTLLEEALEARKEEEKR